MKIFLINIVLVMLILTNSCKREVFTTPEDSSKNRPEICKLVFDNPPVSSEKLKNYSIEELITLQKCGLEYSPEYQLQWDIANHDEYPVPTLVKHLNSEKDEYFQHYLILDFLALTNSTKHRQRLISDKELVLYQIELTISKMQSNSIKKISEIEFKKIKEFFNNVKP